jgi:acyl-CoA thioester hydrolase
VLPHQFRWVLIHSQNRTVFLTRHPAGSLLYGLFRILSQEFHTVPTTTENKAAEEPLFSSTGHDRSALLEANMLTGSAQEPSIVAHDAPALFFAPFVSSRMQIEKGWIDYNGHLNMAYYNVLFDRAVDEAFGLCGMGPDYIRDHHHSFFLVESRIRYRRELTLDDPVRVTLQLMDFDDKRLHYVMEIRHAVDGWLAAACENLSVNVAMTTRRAAPFPAEILANLAIMKAAHAALPQPDMLGAGVAMPAKAHDIN